MAKLARPWGAEVHAPPGAKGAQSPQSARAQGPRALRVLVVGGGIGGLCAAIALRGAGHAVDLVERNPAWDVYGVGIIQPGNALRALDALGLAREAVAAGHPIVGDSTWTADGSQLIAANDWPPLVEGLPPGNGITRPRLHRILQTHTLASGTDVRTGVTFESIDERRDRVDVRFTDGQLRSYDLVVGADGLHSQVRRAVFGAELEARYTGEVCWRYNLPRIEGLDRIWVYLGETGTAGFVPLAGDLMYMLTIEKPPDGAPVRLDRAGLAATYRERLRQFGGPVADCAHLVVDDAEVVYRPVETILVARPWHRGRVVLIGDAAHATSPQCGQGAAQAIEDAIVLTEELAVDRPLKETFEAFTERRYERCRVIVEGSEAIGRWEQDHCYPIDPSAVRHEVTMAAMAPI
ncbi:MAG TPA: FAD-dependent monooxygenase [Solirubrobacteraceae bacterium]|nr:FAD-dependent monooxygenase [Solirubrobacteraceae bacterium]